MDEPPDSKDRTRNQDTVVQRGYDGCRSVLLKEMVNVGCVLKWEVTGVGEKNS